MRLIKMFGLAAIAVGAFMAFIGATSASAVTSLEEVVICKVKEDPCPAGSSFPAGTIIDGQLKSGTVAELKAGSLGKVLCSVSTAEGEVKEALAHGLVLHASFSSCVRDKVLGGTEACTVTTENLPYLWLTLLASDHVKYHTVYSKNAEGAGPPQAHVTCGSVINCTFGATEILFEVLLDEVNHDVVEDVHQSLERSGGVCPSESVWNAEYLVRCLEPKGTFKECWPKMEAGSKLTTP